MKKKKRILSLFLVVMTVFLMFTQHSPFSFAAGGRDLTQDDITGVEVAFYEGGKIVPGDTVDKTVQVPLDFPGTAYTGFYIKVDLKGISANGVANKLKGGDVLRIPIPKNVSLSNSTFKDPKVMMGGAQIGTVAVDVSSGKHDVVVTFIDDVNNLNNVYVELKFNCGVTITQEDQDIEFNIFDIMKVLKINATKKKADAGHILLKDGGGDRYEGDYAYFTYILYVNRAGDNFDKITIKDKLENTTSDPTFDWRNVTFEKSTFRIEEGPSYNPNKILTLTSMSHKYESDASGALKLTTGESATANVPELKFASDFKSFDINVENTGTKGFKIIYELRVPKDDVNKGFTVKNIASIVKTETGEELDPKREDRKKNEIDKKLQITGSASGGGDKLGRILIMKRDADEKDLSGKGKVISDAKFKLKHQTESTETDEISTIDGRALFKNLKLGTYDVIEVSAPVDYETVNNKVVGEVTISNTMDSATKEIENNRKKIDITVNKQWLDPSSEKKDVTFTLKRHIAGGAPASFTQGAVEVTKTLNAGDSFVQFTGLYEYDGNGKKYIYTVEEAPVAGYTSNSPQDVIQETNGIHQATIINKPSTPDPKGSIKITKVDADQPNKGLKGATFKVTNTAGYDKQFTTGDDGIVVVPNLEYGDYTIVETTPPTGYKLNTASQTVTIYSMDEKKVTFENKVTSTPPAPPSNDDDSTPPPSDDGGTGTIGKVEKITPKPPKSEDPKKEDPKKEDPPKPETPADGIGTTTDSPSTKPSGGITEKGSTSGGNETNVLPGVIPGTSSSGTNANVTNKAVTPAHTGKLPKTGEGLNSSAYAMLFAALGMGFVVYGMMRRAKKQ